MGRTGSLAYGAYLLLIVVPLGCMASLKTWICDFRDIIRPRICPICGSPLNSTEQKLCSCCLLQLPYVGKEDFYDNPSSRLFWGRIPVERVYSFIRYRHDSESHNLLTSLKYRHRPDLGVWLGELIARELLPRDFFEDVDCIVAVPLHWRRHLHRGYNQSIELARGISKTTGIPLLRHVVERVRNNKSQTRMSTHERMQNTQHLFCSRSSLSGRHVLLVDDVLTTGATLLACAQAIMATSEDIRISILTLARAS